MLHTHTVQGPFVTTLTAVHCKQRELGKGERIREGVRTGTWTFGEKWVVVLQCCPPKIMQRGIGGKDGSYFMLLNEILVHLISLYISIDLKILIK